MTGPPTAVTVTADLNRCAGSGMCALRAPEVFTQDVDDGRVVVLVEDVTGDAVESAFEAMEICPTGAIACMAHSS